MPSELDPRHAVYVGSFDPPTLGHLDVIRRGSALFGRLTVGIGINPDKSPLFSPDERASLVGELLADLPNVDVACFEGLAVRFARERGAAVLLRGFRMLTDMEAELTMSLANRRLDAGIESVFLVSNEQFSHISSSLIKQVAKLGDESSSGRLREFVPEPVIAPLLEKFAE